MDDADLMAGLLDEVQDEAQLMYDSEEDVAATSEQVPLRVKVAQKCLKPDDPKHLGATNFNGIFMNI